MERLLFKVASDLKLKTINIVNILRRFEYVIENKPNAKITDDMFDILLNYINDSSYNKKDKDILFLKLADCKAMMSESLDLKSLKLSVIPSRLANFTWVKTLILNNNDILKIQNLEKLSNLTTLYLSNNKVEKIDNLFCLVKLKNLWLTDNKISKIEGIDKLINLTVLGVSNNKISKLEGFEKVKQLKKLYASNNLIQKIEGINHLKNLDWLDLASNQIDSFDEIENLIKLKSLCIQFNQISDITPLIPLINNGLEVRWVDYDGKDGIMIKDNPLKTPNIEIVKEGNDSILTFFKSRREALKRIDECKLTKSTGLSLRNLGLSQIPIEIEALYWIERLDLSGNKIKNIENLGSLINLEVLWLSDNQLSEIKNLSNLLKLKELILQQNKISQISNIEGLINLNFISINDNLINDITPLLPFLKRGLAINWNKHGKKGTIEVRDNPIEIPDIETVMRGNEAILNYFNEIERSKKYEADNKKITEKIKRYDIAKLVLVGNSNVGKTNFSYFLRKGELPKRKSTHGMMIDTWYLEEENIQVRIWDFGGQEYYHNTYRLFFQGNCLFNLLWDSKDNRNYVEEDCLIDETKDNPVVENVQHFENEYWLDNISHYASDNSEIFLIQNKDDDLKNRVRIDTKVYDDYTKLKEDFVISLEKDVVKEVEQIKRFNRLKEDIISKICKIKISIKSPDRLNIRNLLIDFQDGDIEKDNPFKKFENNLYISKEEFNTILQQEKLATDLTQEKVIDDFLYSLQQQGLVLYFPENQELKGFIFINPLKLSDEIYRILSQKVRLNNGIYVNTNEEDEVLINIMLRMKVIFKVPNATNENEYIAPQYLSESHALQDLYEIASEEIQNSSFSIKLPLFYYRRVMQQLILHYGKNQEANCKAYFWKHGILIKKDGIRLLIKGLYPNENEREGVISVATDKKKDFLKLQKEVLGEIINTINHDIHSKEEDLNICKKNYGLDDNEIKHNINNSKDFEDKSDYDKNKYFEFIKSIIQKQEKMNKRIELSCDGNYFVKYFDLIQKAKEGELRIEGEEKTDKTKTKSLKIIDFQMILDTEIKKPLKVFISYAHKDRDLFDVFKEELNDWKISLGYEEIEMFEDTKLVVGEPWDEQLKKELNHCDLGILLVSQPFLNSKYIKNEEFGIMKQRKDNNEMVLFPVYFSTCNFSIWEDLAKLQLYKESGEHYGHPSLKEKMCYADLVEWLPNGTIKPNPHRERYMQSMIEEIKIALSSLKKEY